MTVLVMLGPQFVQGAKSVVYVSINMKIAFYIHLTVICQLQTASRPVYEPVLPDWCLRRARQIGTTISDDDPVLVVSLLRDNKDLVARCGGAGDTPTIANPVGQDGKPSSDEVTWL